MRRVTALVTLIAFCAQPFGLLALNTVPGFTPGAFRVSETGAATYSIPLQVPPGVAGMAPSLSLSYSSQGGEDYLGMGWALGGLSAIHRCSRTVAQDGVKGSVNYDANDRFCLDGQRLMAIDGGVYGADGTQYRTERESFSKVTSLGTTAGGGPERFEVRTRAGQIIEYGNSADSRIEAIRAPNATAPWLTGVVRVWAVNKIRDTVGNYIEFLYTEDATNGAYVPSEIKYTGNGAQQPTLSVKFEYEPMPPSVTYVAGSVSRHTKRLSRIKTYYDSVKLVKDYRLAYITAENGKRSRLASIRECAPNGDDCLAPIEIAVQAETDDGRFAAPVSTEFVPHYYSNSTALVRQGDFNGDGRMDFMVYNNPPSYAWQIWLANSDGSFTKAPSASQFPTYYSNSEDFFRLGDFNGDGKTDVMFYTGTIYKWAIRFSNGDGTFTTPASADYTFAAYQGNTQDLFRLGDFNGDGITDVMYYATPPGYKWRVQFSDGNGGFLPHVETPFDTYYSNSSDFFRLADLNGDGLPDAMYYTGTTYKWAVRLADGNGGFLPKVETTFAAYYGNTESFFRVGDFNGDGRADLMTYNLPASYAWSVRFSNGDGTFSAPVSTPFATYYSNSPDFFRLADFNGDGKIDLIYYTGTAWTWAVRFATGDGAFGTPVTTTFGAYHGNTATFFRLGDINGDGKADIATYDTPSNWAWSARLAKTPEAAPDTVTSITNSLGMVMSFVLKPLANGTVYTKGAGAVHPDADFQGAMYVTASASIGNGIGGQNASSYLYGGARTRLDGRGFLGFAWTEATLPSTLKARTEYLQAWPYIGLPSKATRKAGSVVLNDVTNTYACMNSPPSAACTVTAGNRYFVHLAESVELSRDLNDAPLPTVTTTNSGFDANGNVGTVTISTSDGFTKTTVNEYADDVPNWILGRLKKSTVTSSSP